MIGERALNRGPGGVKDLLEICRHELAPAAHSRLGKSKCVARTDGLARRAWHRHQATTMMAGQGLAGP